MSNDSQTNFAQIIEEHLELKRRNSNLDGNMPIDRYRVEDPFENHPLFKTEEQARLEDTLGGHEPELEPSKVLAWPGEDTDPPVDPEDTLWGRSRDFDWGD
ncbi:MAG TPA: hypothetical protein VJ744_04950 [Gaiellaceae bacterium]|nr:hypothetical protein [Gaiellaceae bacterium]